MVDQWRFMLLSDPPANLGIFISVFYTEANMLDNILEWKDHCPGSNTCQALAPSLYRKRELGH